MRPADGDGADHPAKIAQYLLKGWCLLNEYCPNGQNIPLVRSREGALLCCGCDYYVPPPGQAGKAETCTPCAPSPVPAPPLSASALPGSPSTSTGTIGVSTTPTLPPAGEAGGQNVSAGFVPPTRGVGLPATREASGPQLGDRRDEKPKAAGGAPRSPGDGAVAIGGGSMTEQHRDVAADGGGEFETMVRGPDCRFGCAHFIGARGGHGKLSGGSYAVELRLAWAVASSGCTFDVGAVRQALRQECLRLSGRTLVPERSDALSVASAAFQLEVTCEGGSRFNLPREDCVLLPVPQIVPEELAAFFWQRVAESVTAAELRRCGVRWMEVRVADGLHAEATFRREVRSYA